MLLFSYDIQFLNDKNMLSSLIRIHSFFKLSIEQRWDAVIFERKKKVIFELDIDDSVSGWKKNAVKGLESKLWRSRETNGTHRNVELFCNARTGMYVRAQFQIRVR